jgi:DNA adenine methylase
VAKQQSPTLMRSALKWAGGKKKLVGDIRRLLPKQAQTRLIEPFVGGGSVFLNLDFDEYLLIDKNHDLINLFNTIKHDAQRFIHAAKRYFKPEFNLAAVYYSLRAEFNHTVDPFHRSVLFLYLNRHGYNGLCRYNKSGFYNVPFGQYLKPYFPEAELNFFATRAQRAEFLQGDFSEAFKRAQTEDVIYCDPPYSPLEQTSNFTAYSGHEFGAQQQQELVACALQAREQGITTLISNHDVKFTRELYKDANKLTVLKVQRSINNQAHGRIKIDELLALYHR